MRRLRGPTRAPTSPVTGPRAAPWVVGSPELTRVLRLKTSLDLPPVEPRPPIPPRLYKRLYSHLDNILPNATPRTPKSRRFQAPAAATPGSRPRDVDSSPAGRRAGATPQGGTKSLTDLRRGHAAARGSGRELAGRSGGAAGDSALLYWVRPTVRFLCRELDHVVLGPTVMAGMESIAAPQGRRSDDEWVGANMTGLVAAVYFYSSSQLAKRMGGGDVDDASYAAAQRAIVKTLRRAQETLDVPCPDGADEWEGWHDLDKKRFKSAVLQLSERGWLQSDWFRGIKDLKGNGVSLGDGEEGEGDELDPDGPPVQLRRADTMFQDAYQYLDHREQTKAWKVKTLEWIDRVENGEEQDPMEVDS